MPRDDLTKTLSELVDRGAVDRRTFIRLAGAAGIVAAGADQALASGTGCLSCHSQAPAGFRVDANTQALIDRAHSLGIDLLWDRGSPCQIAHKGNGGVAGLCCFRCQMGPCTLGEATKAERGTCGATMDTIVARDLVRRIAGGTAAHAEHARAAARTLKGAALGTAPYLIRDEGKLDAVYRGLGGSGATGVREQAAWVAERTLQDLGQDEGVPAWLAFKANPERKEAWRSLGILPTSAGAELAQALHRTTMGVDADPVNLAADGLKLGLVDGYCGLHAATNIQDILFGTPSAVAAKSGLSVLDPAKVNLVVSGHEPILSEKIVEAAAKRGAGVNVVGMCCTGNEILMRQGVNPAGSMVQQELAIVTGLVDAMVVDVQCVVPNVQRVAERFHTKVITTNAQARIPGATHIPFEPQTADEVAEQIVQIAVDTSRARNAALVYPPPVAPKDVLAGFSVEQILAALAPLGDPLAVLLDQIVKNNIKGIVAVVGCVTPRDAYGYRHVTLTRRLLAENVLVVGTGCWAHAAGQYGLLAPDPTYPGVGSGLKAVLQAVAAANHLPALPACWHMGSCVDNSRIEDVLNAVAGALGKKISDLPVAASAPEFITEKAVAIGTWAVDLGVFTHIGGQPYVSGSPAVAGLLTGGVEGLTGGKFYVEKDPVAAANAILAHIKAKRVKLGLLE